MPWWPGWDSIEWSDFWNTFYFWAGIFCLFFLGASEVVSHYYGERHSDLVAIAASRKADEQRRENERRDRDVSEARNAASAAQDAQQQADERHRAEMAQVQQALDETRRRQAPRRLTPEQRHNFIAELSQFRGQGIAIRIGLGDAEAKNLAIDIVDGLRAAGWSDGGGSGFIQGAGLGPERAGVTVVVNNADAIPAPVAALANALVEIGLMPTHFIGVNPSVSPGAILLLIGSKP